MSGLIHKLVSGKYANTFTGGDVEDLNISGSSETALQVGSVLKVDTTTNKMCYTDGSEQAGYFLQSDAQGCATWVPASGLGENTASNIGSGTGVFDTKVGSDLQFNSLQGGTGITETLAAGTITLTLDDTAVTPATYGDNNSVAQVTIDAKGRVTASTNVDISHDALTDYVANEHINWTDASNAFKTDVLNGNAFLIQNGSSVDVFKVNTDGGGNPITKIDGKLTIEGNYGEALLVRKDGDVKDIFKIDTSNEIVTSQASMTIQKTDLDAFDVKNGSGVLAFRVNTNIPRVEVTAPLRYTGTTPTAGHILESDADGDATWVAPPITFTQEDLVTTYTGNPLPTDPSVTIKSVRFNDTITITWEQHFWDGTGETGGTIATASAIGSTYRPTGTDFFGVVRSRFGGTRDFGVVRVGTNGIITFWATKTLGAFSAAAGNELYKGSVTYTI